MNFVDENFSLQHEKAGLSPEKFVKLCVSFPTAHVRAVTKLQDDAARVLQATEEEYF